MSTESTQSVLITVDELAGLLASGDSGVSVLDVRWTLGGPPGSEEFARGHVPGSVFVNLSTALASPAGDGGRHPLPRVDDFVEAMRAAGVGHGRPVVVLDDWQGRAAARAWWLLRLHGHRDVRVLDGGWGAWVAAGGEVETGPGHAPELGDFVPSEEPGMASVGAHQVLGVEVLIDARAPERYNGEIEPVDPVAGHIPGAVNVPTTANLRDDGTFRDPEEIRAVYAEVGAVPGAEIAVYCGSGVTAAHDVLALASAGIDAALYPGSWSGWVTDPQRPVARA